VLVRALASLDTVTTSGPRLWILLLDPRSCLACLATSGRSTGHGEVGWRGSGAGVTRWWLWWPAWHALGFFVLFFWSLRAWHWCVRWGQASWHGGQSWRGLGHAHLIKANSVCDIDNVLGLAWFMVMMPLLGEVMLEGFGHQVVWMSTREREVRWWRVVGIVVVPLWHHFDYLTRSHVWWLLTKFCDGCVLNDVGQQYVALVWDLERICENPKFGGNLECFNIASWLD
jgi:hypothetical protein